MNSGPVSFPLPPAAVVVADARGVVRYATPEAASFLGGGRGGPVGVALSDAFAVEGGVREEVAAAFRGLLGEPGRRMHLRMRVRDAGGSWRMLAVSGENLVGEPAVGLVVLHVADVTARSDLEAQVLRGQRMQAVGRLAGAVAHDFRNALTVIRASAELARETIPAENPASSELAEIGAAADRALRLTEELLSFARREGGRGPTDLNRLIRGLMPLLTRLMGERARVELSLSDALPEVALDAAEAEQLVLNLATNARDAMPSGGRFVIRTVVAAVGEDGGAVLGLPGGRYAVLDTEDEGSGMDPETLAHVFEPFFSTRAGGTGLGLATVYGIVARSGGQIHVRSEAGRGTLFRAYLPLAGG